MPHRERDGIVAKCVRCGWFAARGDFEGTVQVVCTNNGCGTRNLVTVRNGEVTIKALERASKSP